MLNKFSFDNLFPTRDSCQDTPSLEKQTGATPLSLNHVLLITIENLMSNYFSAHGEHFHCVAETWTKVWFRQQS